jgi:predicted dehydrogenase
VSYDIVGTERIFQYSSEEAGGQKNERTARLKTLFTKGLRVAGDRVNAYLNRPVRPVGDGGTHRPFFDAILSALDMGHPLPVSPEEAREAVELATAIYTSALSGETVTFPLTASSPYYSGVTDTAYESRNESTNTERTVVSLKRGAR